MFPMVLKQISLLGIDLYHQKFQFIVLRVNFPIDVAKPRWLFEYLQAEMWAQ